MSVSDHQNDALHIIASKLPEGAQVDDHALDFKWTPTDAQADKIYVVKFTVKETSTKNHYASAPVTAKIHVWPAGNPADVSQLVISTSTWKEGTLRVKGKVVLNKWMLPTEKTEFLSKTDLAINVTQGKTGTGAPIGNSPRPITLDHKGNWALDNLALPASAAFPCSVSVEINGVKADHKIAGAPKKCLQ